MKPERAFIAERTLAQHCAELVRPAPLTGELLARLDQSGSALCGALSRSLAPLLGHDAPKVEADAAAECAAADLPGLTGTLAVSSLLLAGKDRAPVLVAIEGQAILRMVDRAFGGKGVAPDPLPEALPLSAELMIARLEGLAMAALEAAWKLGGSGNIALSQRSAGMAALTPFPAETRLAVQRMTIAESGGARWTITLALPLHAVADLIGDGARSASPDKLIRADMNPAEEPYGGLPFAVRAVLVDMALPVSTVSALTPGQVLPVSVARSVPLRIGTRTIAHGTIGALDERIAVQISQAF